jgi:hypothetical protein
MPIDAPDVVHLRGGGVSFAVETRGPHLPRVLHWGADLGPLTSAELATLLATADTATTVADADEPRRLSVLPTEAEGWSGTPALAGHRAGSAATPRFTLRSLVTNAAEGGPATEVIGDATTLRLTLTDRITGLRADRGYRLDRHGVLTASIELTSSDQNGIDGGSGGSRHRPPFPMTSPSFASCSHFRRAPPRSSISPDGGPVSTLPSDHRSPTERIIGRCGAAGPASTLRCSRSSARLPSASVRARCGRCTSRGAGTTSHSSNVSRRARASSRLCSAGASSSTQARYAWRPARRTAPPTSSSPGPTPGWTA